jgi:3-oxoacyl-[acyl-carrier protein] reductase
MRNVLVTGGSRGVGLAIARRLVSAGYNVIALARSDSEDLLEAQGEPRGSGTGSINFVSFDLGRIDAIPELVRRVKTEFGPLYGLVNNAALGAEGLLATMHTSQIEALVRVNTVSPIVLSKYVVRSMMSAGEGRIVNIVSVVGLTGYRGLSVYSATKASMIGFTRSLSREVGTLGINVNAVAPGFMETAMTGSLGAEDRARIARRSGLGRLVVVEDIANAVEFLLGDGGRNITGTVLTVDAGATA